MPYRQLTVSGFPALALSNEEVELIVVPSLGGKITNLRRRGGREWLWRNPAIPLQEPTWGASYVETADSGGWDECFPTIGPCPMPGTAPGEPPLPDHGELWALPWRHTIQAGPAGTTLTGQVEGRLLPYDLTRAITLPDDASEFRVSYTLRHRGEVPFPFIWAAHPLLNVQAGTRITIPGAARTRVLSALGRAGVEEAPALPRVVAELGEGWEFPGAEGWAAMLDVELEGSRQIVITDPTRGERLEMEASPGVDRAGLWINAGGWSPAPAGRRRPIPPYTNLGVEPAIGVPDRLDRTLDRWHGAATLTPGEERRWSLVVRLPDPGAE